MQDAITPPTKGKQAVRTLMEGWFKALPDIHYTPTQTTNAGDTAISLYAATGTFKAPMVSPEGTIPATNRHGGWTGCVVVTFNPQGKVRLAVDCYDPGQFSGQFGIPFPS